MGVGQGREAARNERTLEGRTIMGHPDICKWRESPFWDVGAITDPGRDNQGPLTKPFEPG